jgi:uncharacterized protein (TIGR00730 family)
MPAISSLCVYCGSSPGALPVYAAAAERLGAELAKRGVRLVYGGGRVGLMGILADAVLKGGGSVTGVIPGHLRDREVGHDALSELVIVDTMHERKAKMSELADAFAVLPGGLGTLDETFEIITWRQLRLHDKPVVIIDIDGYWGPLHHMVASMVEGGFVRKEHAALFTVVSNVEAAFDALQAMPSPRFEVDREHI